MSIELPIGSYEDALAMVGYKSEPVTAEVPIEEGLIKALAGLVEDPNPAYWRADVACDQWGYRIAPAAVLMCLFAPLLWHPDGAAAKAPLAAMVPLPGTSLINVSTEVMLPRPLRVGDRLDRFETVTALSREKATRAGTGHFVTTKAIYRNQQGDVAAEADNVMLRFTPSAEPATAPTASPGNQHGDAATGEIPPIRLPLEYTRVVGQVAGTRDFMPYHHDPAAARAQGQPTIYVNTMFLEAFIDRVALEWAGPEWFVTKRSMRMLASAHAGQTLTGAGRIVHKTAGERCNDAIDVDVEAVTESGLCTQASLTLQAPSLSG